MSNENEYNRTSDQVGILLVNPEGAPNLNYYYCLVDLPTSDSLIFEEPDYDSTTKTLTFGFSYNNNNYPASNAELKTYPIPVYFIQTEEGEPVNINTIEVVGTTDGVTTTVKKGQTANQKKKILVGGMPEAQNALTTSGTPTGGDPAPVDELRWLMLQSFTNSNEYFLIVMVRTNNGNSRLLVLEPTWTTNNEVGVQVSYQETGNPPVEGNYVAATNLIPSQNGAYASIFLDSSEPVEISYSSPAPTQV